MAMKRRASEVQAEDSNANKSAAEWNSGLVVGLAPRAGLGFSRIRALRFQAKLEPSPARSAAPTSLPLKAQLQI
jgi:hypothetical protein